MTDEFSNESRLLMYLADELPAQERQRVEEMVERDALARAQLDELRTAQEGFFATMQHADANQHLAVSEPVAVRKIARVMRQWQVDRYKRPPIQHYDESRSGFPWWCYPLATAAAAVFAVIVWVGNDVEAPPALATGPRDEIIAQAEESWALSAESTDASPQFAMGEDEFNNAFAE